MIRGLNFLPGKLRKDWTKSTDGPGRTRTGAQNDLDTGQGGFRNIGW